jgi:hypothetical protein
MQNSALRRPKRERVIETVWILVLELDGPGGAAIECLVNTEISRVVNPAASKATSDRFDIMFPPKANSSRQITSVARDILVGEGVFPNASLVDCFSQINL